MSVMWFRVSNGLPARTPAANEGDNMAVYVTHTGAVGSEVYGEEEGGAHSYKVLDSGVLQILVVEDGEWIVKCEYSPSSWERVEGTRFIGETSSLGGSEGTSSDVHQVDINLALG